MSQLSMEFSFQAVILDDIFYIIMREMDTGRHINRLNPLHCVKKLFLIFTNYGNRIFMLGCPENTKSLKSHAPQG